MQILIVLEPGWEKINDIFFATTHGLGIVEFKEAVMPANFWREFLPKNTDTEYYEKRIIYLSCAGPCVFIIVDGDCLFGCPIELAKDQILRLRKRYYRTSEHFSQIASFSESDEEAKRQIELYKRFYSLQIGCKT